MPHDNHPEKRRNIAGSPVPSPAISSVHFYHKTMGQEAARMLVEILESGDDLKKHLKMGYQIVKKESLR